MPTILKIRLDAGDYEKELQKVVDQTKELQAKIAQTNSVSVKVDPSDMSDLSDVSDKVEELEGTHEVKVNVKTSGAEKVEQTSKDLKKSNGVLKDLWSSITKTEGAGQKLAESFAAGGGAVELFAKAIQSVVKIAQHFFESEKRKTDEFLKDQERAAAHLNQLFTLQDQQFSNDNSLMATIKELNSQENLSIKQKANLADAVDRLNKAYKGLGLSIDSVTGKAVGVDNALEGMQKAQMLKKMELLQSKLRSLESSSGVLFDANRGGGFDRFWQVVEPGRAEEEAARRDSIVNETIAVRSEISILKRELAAMERTRKAAERERNRPRRGAAVDEQARQAHLDVYRKRTAALREQAFSEGDLSVGNALLQEDQESKRSIEREIRHLQRVKDKARLQETALDCDRQMWALKTRLLEIEDRILARKKQIATIQKQAAAQAAAEAAAKAEEAKRKREEEARQKAGLKGYFVGQVRQVGPVRHVEQALKDARAAKGADLTDEESEAVRKIAKLTYSMNNRRENNAGDLSIKTNSLTARGGFQGGAVAPDLERYNRITAENSRQSLARMRTLESNVAKILRIFEG